MAILTRIRDATAQIFIGTSNVVLPGPKNTFPNEFQDASRLGYYSTLFNSVEINSTFYKTPLRKTLERWSLETQNDFVFTIKLSRIVTHQKNLEYNAPDIDSFFEVISSIGKKKACLLVQFPGSITEDYYEKVEAILKRIRRNNRKRQWNVAVEFRHDSWYEAHVYRMLFRQEAHLVVHDKGKARTPTTVPLSTIVYLRFHGPNGDYRGGYTEQFMLNYAAKIKEWLTQKKTVYAYFNNTMGSAFADATLLQSLLNSTTFRE